MSPAGKGYVECDSAIALPMHSCVPRCAEAGICSADLNRFRFRAVRTASLSCHCHRGLLCTSDYNSRERLRQLNFIHKAHLPVAHGTSLWIWSPLCAPQRKWRSHTGIIRLGSHFKRSTEFSTKGFFCMVLLVSELKYYSCNKSIL